MLTVEGIEAGYGAAQVLHGVSLQVGEGEAVALLGRNGMGKTTTLRTIMGLIRPGAGRIGFRGRELTGAPPYRVARAGLGYVPEGRQIFPTLSVEENLVATSRRQRDGWTVARVFDLFPRLAERRSNPGVRLSGGEQQMLAIGRALMTNPSLLILDEATEGLAPLIREEVWSVLARLKAEGQAVLLVDKNVEKLARFTDRFVVLEKGAVVWHGTPDALRADPQAVERYLHV